MPPATDPIDRLAALASPDRREALLFARRHGCAFTVDEAAAALGCHRTAARRRLDALERAGLLAARFGRPGEGAPGAGRPAKWFWAAPELEVAEFPPHRYAELVGLLLDELPQGPAAPRGARLRATGRRFAGLLSRPPAAGGTGLEEAMTGVVRDLGALGYSARLVEAGPERAVLAVPACPLRPVVLASPEAAEIDHGMWEALAEGCCGRGAVAECATAGCLDRGGDCRVVISLTRERARA